MQGKKVSVFMRLVSIPFSTVGYESTSNMIEMRSAMLYLPPSFQVFWFSALCFSLRTTDAKPAALRVRAVNFNCESQKHAGSEGNDPVETEDAGDAGDDRDDRRDVNGRARASWRMNIKTRSRPTQKSLTLRPESFDSLLCSSNKNP